MKPIPLATSLLCLALAAASARASTLYWSGNGSALGGGGTWNTTGANWGTSTSGAFTTVWNNANSDTATLSYGAGATGGGSVVIGTGITMNGTLTWQQTAGTYASYTINGGSTMTFSSGSSLNANNSAGGGINIGSFNSPYAGTITKSGNGFLTFNNADGAVTKFIFSAGTAAFAAPSRFGSGANSAAFLTFNGGTMSPNTTTAWTMGKSITVNSGNGTIASSSASITITQDQPITWNNGNLTIAASTSPLNLSSTTSSGTGTLTLSTTTTCKAAGVIPSGVVVTLNSGSTLAMANNAQTISSLSGSTSVTLGSGTLTLANGRHTFSGVISGSGGLIQSGTSTETLSGNNTYTGATVVSNGSLVLNGTSTTGSITVSNGTLVINANCTCAGASTINTNGILTLGAASVLTSSPIVVNPVGILDVDNISQTIAGLSGSGVVSNNAGQTLTVSGNLTTAGTTSGTGFQVYSCYYGTFTNGYLVKDGTHTMALRGTNTFDDGGTISFGSSGAEGTLSVGAAPNRIPVTTSLSVPSGATFQLDANSQTLASLSSPSPGGNVNLGGGILTDNESGYNTFYGVIQDSDLPGSSTALGNGLRGYYYNNIDMSSLGAVRDDTNVFFTDLTSSNQLPPAVYAPSGGTNTDSARWLGKILSTAAGTYTFTTTCDDGRRLWINGQLVVDSWVSGATTKTGTITLAANTLYDIVFEWFNGAGGAKAELLWTPPGDTASVAVPSGNLFLPGAGAFVMNGTGTLNLVNPNSYSGTTIVAAGSLVAQTDGALGNGNVIVSNTAYLSLQNNGGTNGYLSSSANLLLGASPPNPLVNLAFSDPPQNICGLSFDGGVTYQPAGTYGSSSSSATYQNDTFFSGSGVLNVSGAPTTTSLASSGSPSATYGLPLTLTATVFPSTANGTVTFYDGANWLGTNALVSGVATLSVSNLQVSASPHALTAVYSGDATDAPSASAPVSQTTTVATLTPNIVVANKTYDGTTAATISAGTTFTGILSTDTNYVHIAGTAVANFVDKNVGVGKTVNITGLALAGSLSSNYQMPATSTTVTANITNAVLTISGITATNRVYDANTDAGYTGSPVLNGVISPDNVTNGPITLAFATKTIGTAKPVTVTAVLGGDANTNNYILVLTNLSANITSFATTVTSVSANSKTYDGTTAATLSGTPTPSPAFFGGDDVHISATNMVAAFTNANYGLRGVTITGYALYGNDSGNYTLSQPTVPAANIYQAQTATAITCSPNPSTVGSNVTFTLTVTSTTPTALPPNGTATFYTNGTPLIPTVALVSNTPTSSSASYSTANLPLGTTPVAAQFSSGDGNYLAPLNPASTNQVVQTGSTCSQTNRIVSVTPIGGNWLLLTNLGTPQAQYYLLSQTNVGQPLANWLVVPGSTNTVTNANGLWYFTVTNPAPAFYRVKAINACQ